MRQRTYLASALAIVLGWGLLDAGSASAQTSFPDVRGGFRGFSQSVIDPNVRGPMQLSVDVEDFAKGSFSGQLIMGDQPFLFSGKIDMFGHFKGTGRSQIGAVKLDGKFGDQGGGGGLVRFEYLFTYPTGLTDQGDGKFIRNFDPRSQGSPPDVSGSWAGPYHSVLAGGDGTVDLMVQQDRDPATGDVSTGFSGQEILDRCTSRALMFDFVGTVNGDGKTLIIGFGAAGQFVAGGPVDPNSPGWGSIAHDLGYQVLGGPAKGFMDLATFMVSRLEVPPDPCREP